MYRRTLLTVGAPVGLLLAGCLGGQSGSGGSGDEGTADDSPTDVTVTDGGSPPASESSFEVLAVRTSDGRETASVTFTPETITVTGTIGGNNGCYTARLGSVTTRDGTLVVNVESYEDAAENQDCTQALVAIEYRSTVDVEGNLPDSVTVRHNGEPVATEARS